MPVTRDYSFLFWPYGWRGRSPGGKRVISVQTGRYGMTLDVETMEVLSLGALRNAPGYRDAASQSAAVVTSLPHNRLTLSVRVGSDTFTCDRGAVNQADTTNFPVRMIECGRYVNRFDVLQLEFKNARGERLDAEGRLEVTAWPDRLSFELEIKPKWPLNPDRIAVSVDHVPGAQITSRYPYPDGWPEFSRRIAWCALEFDAPASSNGEHGLAVSATDPLKPAKPVPVTFDPVHNWHSIQLPNESWQESKDLDHLERVKVHLENKSGTTLPAHLQFAKDYPFAGVTGMTPMLRDMSGNPTGIPVQLSKDWHQTAGHHFPMEGPWFHGYSMLYVEPHSSLDLEFDLTYGRWGGLPAASHAQLCLIGYAVNQLWDQAALGSWGESITYDPDVNLNRSMIDDVRPLMVTQMNTKDGKWAWTNNVGGGDFLAYFNTKGEKQFLTRMKTAYLSQGPNLTDVVYSGISADGAIAAKIEVSTPRSNDINRAIHRFRYDVLKPVEFSRLAFYQVGSDNYNDNQFDRLARGDSSGLKEEWSFVRGGKRYDRTPMACSGIASWFSMHRAINTDKLGGAWANRGLVIRSYRARLGGTVQTQPYAACYGTENGIPGMNVEISPPPGVHALQPGDYVDAEVELVIMPQSAGDYYGPNEALRLALSAHGNSWQPIWREAAANTLAVRVSQGKLEHTWPLLVTATASQHAALTITGGVGFAPVTFAGLSDFRGYSLWQTVRGVRSRVDQSVHGNDFWQSSYSPADKKWSITYNVGLDSPGDNRQTIQLNLQKD